MSLCSAKQTQLHRAILAFGLSVIAAPFWADDLMGDAEQGAALHAERCARCHDVAIEMVLAPEDAPRVAEFLASHKTRFDPTRSAQENADLAAYLVSLSPTQRN